MSGPAGAAEGAAEHPVRKRIAWTLWIGTVTMGLATTAFVLPTGSYPRPEWHPWAVAVFQPAALVAFAYPGFVVALRRPRNRVGWLLLVSGFGGVLDSLGHAHAVYALAHDLPGIALSAWVSNWAFALNFFPVYALLLCFPDGRFPTGRRRIATWYVAACAVFVMCTISFIPGSIDRDYFPQVQNPFGVSWLMFFHRYEGLISFLVVALPFLASACSLLLRFRRSTGVARLQFKWVAFAALAAVTLVVVTMPLHQGAWGTIAIDLGLVVLSASIALAIVRHNLFDIDRLLSRSLVYLGLTGCVVGLYAGTVSLFGLLLQRSASGVAPLLATGVVAAALQPLRTVLQKTVSRLVYGLRDDPYAALAGLGRRLEAVGAPQRVLPEAAATVAEALRSPFVAIELDGSAMTGGTRARVAFHGAETRVVVRLPLVYQGEEIGTLAIAARSAEERYSPADLRLLQDTARHIAQAAASVRLSLDVQHSQKRAVAARAEERRRLSKDLHDGIDPVLTEATSTVEEAAALVRTAPDRAHELLVTALDRVRLGGEDLRRISMGLRSPVDQLGLREAVLGYLDRVSLTVHVTVPDELPRLPAAVEEVTYLTMTEAVTNVMRHARAESCWVSLELGDEHLTLTVADNGQGPPEAFRPGAGLTSIRERAAEIGGSCAFRARPGGGSECVTCLPCPPADTALPATRDRPPWQPGAGHRQGDRAGGEP